MNKWELIVRRRPNLSETPEEVHAGLVEVLLELPEPWRLQSPLQLHSKPGNLSSTANFRGKLGTGLTGYATYALRSNEYLRDTAQFDDHCAFEFNPQKFDLALLADVVLPRLVVGFNAYRATVYDKETAVLEWPELAQSIENSGRDLDGRHGINKISPLAYYEDALIRSELGISGGELAHAAPDCVVPFRGGVIVRMPLDPKRAQIFTSADRQLRALAGQS